MNQNGVVGSRTSVLIPFLFLWLITKLDKKSNYGRGSLTSSQFQIIQFIVTGKSEWQKLNAAGLKTPTVKSRENWVYLCSFACFLQCHISTLIQVRTSCIGNGTAHSGLCLPTSIYFIKTILQRHAHRPTLHRQCVSLRVSSQVILGVSKSSVRANHHS